MGLFNDANYDVNEDIMEYYLAKFKKIKELNIKDSNVVENSIQKFFIEVFKDVTNNKDIDNPLASYTEIEDYLVERINVIGKSTYDFENTFDCKKFSFIKEEVKNNKTEYSINPSFKKLIGNMPSDRFQESLYYLELKADNRNRLSEEGQIDTSNNLKKFNILKEARKSRGFFSKVYDFFTGRYKKENKMIDELEDVIVNKKLLDKKTMTKPNSIIELEKLEKDNVALDKYNKEKAKRIGAKYFDIKPTNKKPVLEKANVDNDSFVYDNDRYSIEVIDELTKIETNQFKYGSVFGKQFIFKDELSTQERFSNLNNLQSGIETYKRRLDIEEISEEELDNNYNELKYYGNFMGITDEQIDTAIKSEDVEKYLLSIYDYTKGKNPVIEETNIVK